MPPQYRFLILCIITPRLITLFLIISLLPILLSCLILYSQASETTQKDIDKTLSAMKNQSVLTFLQHGTADDGIPYEQSVAY